MVRGSLFRTENFRHMYPSYRLNTGTPLDIATGVFVKGKDGSTILNGGFSNLNGSMGRQQMCKSTMLNGTAMCTWARCPGAENLLADTEDSQVVKRLMSTCDVEPHKDNRFTLTERGQLNAEELYATINTMAMDKEKHIKDFLVESPFIDEKGKPVMIIMPTFVGIDSLTMLQSSVEDTALQSTAEHDENGIKVKNSISGSHTNILAMNDGRVKTNMLNQLLNLSKRMGIYYYMTAHVGGNISMGGMPGQQPTKQLTYMKSDEKAKGASARFLFIANILANCEHVEKMILSGTRTEPEYPSKEHNISGNELLRLRTRLVRNKLNISGSVIHYVISQTVGIDTPLSYYDYVRSLKYADGFTNKTSAVNQYPSMLPETRIGRTTIYDQTNNDPRLCRALEIIGSILYMKANWNPEIIPEVIRDISINEIVDKLNSDHVDMNSILDSRGWWQYKYPGYTNPQEYLSIIDIANIAMGNYKPKWLGYTKELKKAA